MLLARVTHGRPRPTSLFNRQNRYCSHVLSSHRKKKEMDEGVIVQCPSIITEPGVSRRLIVQKLIITWSRVFRKGGLYAASTQETIGKFYEYSLFGPPNEEASDYWKDGCEHWSLVIDYEKMVRNQTSLDQKWFQNSSTPLCISSKIVVCEAVWSYTTWWFRGDPIQRESSLYN